MNNYGNKGSSLKQTAVKIGLLGLIFYGSINPVACAMFMQGCINEKRKLDKVFDEKLSR